MGAERIFADRFQIAFKLLNRVRVRNFNAEYFSRLSGRDYAYRAFSTETRVAG